MPYTRLSIEDREQIYAGLVAGASYVQIAQAIGRSVSTVSREITRNKRSNNCYSPHTAQQKAVDRAHKTHRRQCRILQPARLRALVHRLLGKRWSPRQIAVSLQQRFPETTAMHISHESIYTYIYMLPRGELKKELQSSCASITACAGAARANVSGVGRSRR